MKRNYKRYLALLLLIAVHFAGVYLHDTYAQGYYTAKTAYMVATGQLLAVKASDVQEVVNTEAFKARQEGAKEATSPANLAKLNHLHTDGSVNFLP